MKFGNKIFFCIFSFFLTYSFSIYPEDTISSTPLINLDKIKPSFEAPEADEENINESKKLKNKEKLNPNSASHAVLIGLDKITAKSSKIFININEKKFFGPLEIKILKCGKVKMNNKINDVAYMQVKDISKNENDKVFIFNGWTFSSDPNLTPFDHAIYDLQLLNCYKA